MLHYESLGEPAPAPFWPGEPSADDGAVTAVGCRWYARDHDGGREDRGYVSIGVDEFVEFASGRRLSMRWDRGATLSSSVPAPGLDTMSPSQLDSLLDGALLPDEGETEDQGERRSWHEYSLLLEGRGVRISAAALKALPYLREPAQGNAPEPDPE